MVKDLKLFSLFLTITFFCHNICAAPSDSFNYQNAWRIVYFQGEEQFIRQRPTEYNRLQGFIYIYEILIKYVYQMQKFNQVDPINEMNALGVWTQIYLINDVSEQELFIGDHVISDGQSWVILGDEDYSKLSEFLKPNTNKRGDPFDGDIAKALEVLSWKNSAEHAVGSFDTNFRASKSVDTTNEIDSKVPQLIDTPKSRNLRKSASKIATSQNNIENKSSLDAQIKLPIKNYSVQSLDDQSTGKARDNRDIKDVSLEKKGFEHVTWPFLIACLVVAVYYYKRRK